MELKTLGVTRLSQLSEVTTSPERQAEHQDKWIKVHGGTLVHRTQDLGVSGSLSPFERPSLGPWLTDTPPKPWDVMVAWRLDRVGRDALDTLLLLQWLDERGKRLVTVADGLDSAGPYAKAFITLAAVFAEMARTTSLEMSADARAKLRADGKWLGGGMTHGYRLDSEGRLEINPDTEGDIRRIFEMAANGVRVPEIARKLQWLEPRVFRAIRNHAYIGIGPVPTPAIIDPETFEKAQKPTQVRIRSGSAELTGVVCCLVCGHILRIQRQGAGRGRSAQCYYRCPEKGHTLGIRAEVLAELATIEFVSAFGAEPVIDEIVHPDTTAAEAALCRVELTQVAGQMADGDRVALLARMSELSEKLTELEARSPNDRVERVNTGRTWAEEVDRLTLAELGDELRQRGVRIGVRKTSHKPEVIEVEILTGNLAS